MITVLAVIVAGLMNFNPALLTLPANAFRLDGSFAAGLGAAMLIAIYDYLGYYNICHLGDEVRDPGRTIPRAVMLSVAIVATIYLTMNVSIIAVIPWQEAQESRNIAAMFMERLYGRGVAVAFTVLILWTVVACMFAITLGYSRIPFAAARQGDFFRPFALLHARGYPLVSLWAMGILTAVFCFFPLESVIKAAVTVRIVVQFIGQIVALHVLRSTLAADKTECSVPSTQAAPLEPVPMIMPFRMWLYPLPSLIALAGWLFVLGTSGIAYLAAGAGVIVSGCIAFAIWTFATKDRTTV
jgi:amino acid transporter